MAENTTDFESQVAPKVMIVEDDVDISRALQMRLEMSGYDTCQAFDALTPFDVAKEHGPAIILLDLTLPGGTGFDVARRLRADPATETIPIVFLTASLDPGLEETAEEVGGAAFLQKPIDSTKLLEALRTLLPQAAQH